jgi:hypothetical protein
MEPDRHSRVFSGEKYGRQKCLRGTYGNKAAACSRAALATNDPKRREILTYLGEFWINLANANPDDKMGVEIAMIERMQDELLGTAGTLNQIRVADGPPRLVAFLKLNFISTGSPSPS